MTSKLLRLVFALIACALLAVGIAACGDDEEESDTGGETSAEAIQENPDNNGIELTVGSKNFTEQFILGEIYAQAFEAAGYDVKTDLNLGSEQIALKALQDGEISGYPEYTSTALTAFFDVPAEEVPNDAQQAVDDTQQQFADDGLVAFDPTVSSTPLLSGFSWIASALVSPLSALSSSSSPQAAMPTASRAQAISANSSRESLLVVISRTTPFPLSRIRNCGRRNPMQPRRRAAAPRPSA